MIRFEQQPCTFDGVSTNVHDYFIHFEAVSSWNNWSMSEMACQLIINLRGEAQTLLRFLKQNQLKDFEYLKNLLFQRFNPQERSAYFKFELKTCSVRLNENMIDFGHRFKTLCHKAHPDLFHELDSYFIDLFVTSLEKEMSKFVHFNHPKSLDEAIRFAVEFESFSLANGEIKFDQCEAKDDCIVTCLKSGFEKIAEAVKKFVKKRKPKVKKCFKCCEKGHVRARCPNKVSNPPQSLSSSSDVKSGTNFSLSFDNSESNVYFV